MRIGILTTGFPPSCANGAEVQAEHVAERLSRKNRVIVFTRSAPATDIDGRTRPFSVCRRTVVNIPAVRFPADIISSAAVIGKYRKEIDAILAYQTIIDGLIGVVVKKLFGIPVVVSVRGEDEYRISLFRKSRLFSPFVFRNADRIFMQTEMTRDAMIREIAGAGMSTLAAQVREKVRVVPNGVTVPHERAGEGDAVLFVGRLVKEKGTAYLIEAMKQCPGQKLVVVGEGPERENLEKAAEALTSVEFAGRVPTADVPSFMARASMLVLPSLSSEGMPNVILEAMALGLPVVSTRIAGIPEVVMHGRTGYLAEPGDAGELSVFIRRLGADKKLARELGRNGRKEARSHSWDKVLALMEQELRSVLN